MATIPSGYPSSANTGVPAGTQLSVYTGPMTITKDGTVIDGKIINGTLVIQASNVVIKNSQINYKGWWGIDGERAKNLTVQDNDIIGPGYSADSNAGILGSGTFLRNDISKSENGIVLVGGSSTVKGNYIHDLQDGGKDPHYDGISVQGGQNGVLIEGNTVEGRDTSNIFIKNDFGPINNVTVKGNYLIGNPGYMIYVDGRANGGAITNIQINGNYLEKGFYGHYNIEKSSPVLSGNTLLNDGQLPPAISPSPATPSVPTTPSESSAPIAPAAPKTPTEPTAPSVPKAPPASGGTDSGGSPGSPQGNAPKAPGAKIGTNGDHSTGSLDPVKVGGHASPGVKLGFSAGHDGGGVSKAAVGSHGSFKFDGLPSFNVVLDRVADHFSSYSGGGNTSGKIAKLAAYVQSVTNGEKTASGDHHGEGLASNVNKQDVSHDNFHVI